MNANDSGRMPPPLSPSALALLAHERAVPSRPEMVRARALARAREALSDTPSATQSPRVSPTRVRWPLYAAAAGIALVAGVAAAFQIVGRPTPLPPASKGMSRAAQQPVPPSEVPGPATTNPTEAEPADSAPAVAVASARVSASSHRPVLAGKHDGGMEELQLLGRARQSDAHGDYAEVLATVAEHERNFPAGRLSEEREVLRVKALVGLGRGSEARHAVAQFHRQFPRSVLLHKIDDMLASLR